MKRVALYVRVSTEEQHKHGLSVDAQITALEAYSRANNYTIHKIYNDAGISARKTYKKRPALLEMISDCQKGYIDLILITKLDRFFRSVSDYYAVMDQIGNVPWKAIQEDYETETSAGVFKVNIMLSVAQSEADKTSERIKAVFDYKRAKGEATNGKTSVGYRYNNGLWVKDPETQKGVEAFFNTYLTTFNKKLAKTKAQEHNVKISDETARFMLYGNNYYPCIPYITEPYISVQDHDKIMEHKPNCSRQKKYNYIFSGLCRCGQCGRLMSASTSTRTFKNGTPYFYKIYICDYGRRNFDCTGSAISEKILERIMLDTLETELQGYNLKITLDSDNDNSDKLHKCQDRLKRLKVLFEMGDIELEEYKLKRTTLQSEIDNLQSHKLKEPIHLDSNWKDIYEMLDTVHKNAFWKNIIESIEVPKKQAKSVKIQFK